MGRKLKILVLGPMGERIDEKTGNIKTDKSGVSIGEHIPNIVKAARQLDTEDFFRENREIIIKADGPGSIGDAYTRGSSIDENNIPKDVFEKLEHYDFIIADLSERSFNVAYEIAVAHSLGKPYILIDLKSDSPVPFYFSQTKVRFVPDFSVESLKIMLRPELETFVSKDGFQDKRFSSNKLTEHFNNIPLIDVSVISGIAAGYFHNFVRHFLDLNGPISQGKFSKLIVVKPDRVQQVDEFKNRITPRFNKGGFNRVKTGFKIDTEGMGNNKQPRTFAVTLLDDRYVVDYPTPIEAIIHAANYKKMLERASTEELNAYEIKMIDAFFHNLETFIKSDRINTKRDYLEIYSEEDLYKL